MTLTELHLEANHLRTQRDAIVSRIEKLERLALGHPDTIRKTDALRFQLLPPIHILLNKVTARIETIEARLAPQPLMAPPNPDRNFYLAA
jgi:hypothetical protein